MKKTEKKRRCGSDGRCGKIISSASKLYSHCTQTPKTLKAKTRLGKKFEISVKPNDSLQSEGVGISGPPIGQTKRETAEGKGKKRGAGDDIKRAEGVIDWSNQAQRGKGKGKIGSGTCG